MPSYNDDDGGAILRSTTICAHSPRRSFDGLVRYLMTRNSLPYHNYYHAIDVMQTCFVILETFEAGNYCTELESFGLVIAAICHDLDHPGLNNNYQINSQTQLALRFNDSSCLENMHSYLCFSILRKNGCDIFAGLDKGDRVLIRKLIISCIISTDMTYHFSLSEDLNNMIESVDQAGGAGDFLKDEKDRDTLLKAILHISDISNPAKEFQISKKWSDVVIKEFFAQGDLEEKKGLSVSMGCDRATTEQESLSLNFCDFVAAPFFFCLVDLLPKIEEPLNNMKSNREEWHNRQMQKIIDGKDTEPAAANEECEKWERRAAAFEENVQAALGRQGRTSSRTSRTSRSQSNGSNGDSC